MPYGTGPWDPRVPVLQLRATQSAGPNPAVTVSQWLRAPCIRFLGSLLILCPSSLQVTNVDDEGVELGSGVMELTQSELVLHLHQRDAVRWPYLCLRRYGYDSNLFSFESGRRCQTGQGEYQSVLQDRDMSLLQNWSVALHILTSDIRLGDVAQSRERSRHHCWSSSSLVGTFGAHP